MMSVMTDKEKKPEGMSHGQEGKGTGSKEVGHSRKLKILDILMRKRPL